MTDLSSLNPQQRAAVEQSINNNVVLVAGAGSGKTHTLVKRTQYLIDDMGVDPASIMMVTFTNKAAKEMLERVIKVSPNAKAMWIGTFHRICTRLIRIHGHKLGIQNFTIMDTKESKELIRGILKDKGVEYTPYMVNDIVSHISTYKNNLIKPAQVLLDQTEKKIYADVYQEYQNISWRRKSFDFDDLIIYTILLLSSYPDVLSWVHDRFKYIMVDETQDTNSAQFTLIKLIIGENNIMMVGDANQSIYAFRNAKPQYLEDFALNHPNTIKLRLEQNYRSTKTIINAANNVITYNKFGTKLSMFCANEEGEKIQLYEALDPYEEARWIASEILAHPNKPLSDYAIIYRTNSQSRIIEEELTKDGIGYTIFGSQSFYTRKEVKDLLAWLKSYLNPKDIDSFKRVLGTIKGVGTKTIESIINMAESELCDYRDAIMKAIPNPSVLAGRLAPVANILTKSYNTCTDIIFDVLQYTDYKRELLTLGTEEAAEKIELINEFQNMLRSMETSSPNEPMSSIVDQVSLLSDTKGADKQELNAVKLMTAHASKGLEFDTVFIIGAEEATFPHANALSENTNEAIEEERRLFYVAMTRAEKKLYICHSRQRKQGNDGSINVCAASRFIGEIPRDLTEEAF